MVPYTLTQSVNHKPYTNTSLNRHPYPILVNVIPTNTFLVFQLLVVLTTNNGNCHLIYKGNSGVCVCVCLSVWQTGQGRGDYACIFRPLSSSSATWIFGPIRWLCLSVVTNRAGAGRPRQTPAHWTCWLYIGSLGKTGDLHLIKQKYNLKKKLFSL